jgi:hypothetical protein
MQKGHRGRHNERHIALCRIWSAASSHRACAPTICSSNPAGLLCSRLFRAIRCLELAYVLIQNPACRTTDSIRQHRANPPDKWRIQVRKRLSAFRVRVSIICQHTSSCAKPVLKGNQALMIKVSTTKIDLLNSRCLTFFDELPEEKRHSAEIVELLV